jgi:hypothetical protein
MNPSSFLLLGVVLLLALGVVAATVSRVCQRRRTQCYRVAQSLFTPAETRFWHTLSQAIPAGTTLFGKVRMADVFTIAHGDQNAIGRIWAKHFDYVVVDLRSGKPLLAIELDDSSHQRKDRIDRDIFVNKICQAATLPLLRVPVMPSYDREYIASQVFRMIRLGAAAKATC